MRRAITAKDVVNDCAGRRAKPAVFQQPLDQLLLLLIELNSDRELSAHPITYRSDSSA